MCFNFNVVSTQGKKDAHLSVSTMSNNNSQVETKVSLDLGTISLCTSTKTSDYHSTQSTGSDDSEPQNLSESKTEASSSTKISSGYYSDQSDSSEAARPAAKHYVPKTGVFCSVHSDKNECSYVYSINSATLSNHMHVITLCLHFVLYVKN